MGWHIGAVPWILQPKDRQRGSTIRSVGRLLHCMTYFQHKISRPVGHFILGPLDIWNLSLWNVLSCLCSARGCFVAASKFWDDSTWLFFHSWFREEETVMRLARTARGFGDPLAGNWYKQLLLIFFLFFIFVAYFLFFYSFTFSNVREDVPLKVGCAVGQFR